MDSSPGGESAPLRLDRDSLQNRLDRLSTAKNRSVSSSRAWLLGFVFAALLLLTIINNQFLVRETEHISPQSMVMTKERTFIIKSSDGESVEPDPVKHDAIDEVEQVGIEDHESMEQVLELTPRQNEPDEKQNAEPQVNDANTHKSQGDQEGQDGQDESESDPEDEQQGDERFIALTKAEEIRTDGDEVEILAFNKTLLALINATTTARSDEPLLDSALVNVDRNSEFYRSFYAARYLPSPQLDFYIRTGRKLRYQMHNCLKGRDGSKAGLLDNRIPRVKSQKSIENMPLHIIDPAASIIVACNTPLPVYNITRNSRVAGKRLVSTTQGLLSKLCLGSRKNRQLECRRALAQRWGCAYESLNIQPAQFILSNPTECEEALKQGKMRDRAWLSKPSGGIQGRGIRYFANTRLLEKDLKTRGGCSRSNATGLRGRIVQEYVGEPALIDGKFKFDVRTWLLVASVDPLIIFYHEGLARVAKVPYNPKSGAKLAHVTNIWAQYDTSNGARESSTKKGGDADEEDGKYMRSFAHISEQLNRYHGLPKDYMQNDFRKKMMRATLFAALSQFTGLEDPPGIVTKRGFYQLYACDSMVDRHGGAHLLECNGFPAEAQQLKVSDRTIWAEMIALLLNLHLEPWRLMEDSAPPPGFRRTRYVREGIWKTGPSKVENAESFKANTYAFGGWYLAFNEIETPLDKFDVCKI